MDLMGDIRASVSKPPAVVKSTLPKQMWLEAFYRQCRSRHAAGFRASAALYWTLLETHQVPGEAVCEVLIMLILNKS